MARHPLNEGSIAEIFRRFFGPLIRYKHPEQSLSQFLGELFGVNEREVTRYRVEKPFKMPGLLAVAPLQYVQGIGARDIKRGDILWVRTDSTTPTSVDVQWLKPGHDLMFKLTSSEWGLIKLNCKARVEAPREY